MEAMKTIISNKLTKEKCFCNFLLKSRDMILHCIAWTQRELILVFICWLEFPLNEKTEHSF